ncbi:MAG: hypothetical protein K2I98_05295, partial [Prevotella sp.]|nr:hypothetical protein [Prevotella sp.]
FRTISPDGRWVKKTWLVLPLKDTDFIIKRKIVQEKFAGIEKYSYLCTAFKRESLSEVHLEMPRKFG